MNTTLLRLLLPALGTVLAGSTAAQRVRTLAPAGMAGAPPVTAHRQVAWASGGTVYLWNGSSVMSLYTSGNVVDSVGFVAPGRVFFTVQGGPYYGYSVWDLRSGWARLLTNPIDSFHTDGNAAVFPLPGYAGFGVYTSGSSFTSIPDCAATTYQPRVNGRYIVLQRRTGTGYADYNVYGYDRETGGRVLASASTSGGTDGRIDETGRIVYIAGASTGSARTWWNDFVGFPRMLVDVGFGAMVGRYDANRGMLAYSRRQFAGSGPFDLRLEERAMPRIIDTASEDHREVLVRSGMVAWMNSGGFRLFDGRTAMTVNPSQSGLPRGGSPLDRGWVVYGGNGGPVMLRESSLTWDRETLSTSGGGVVTLDLIAGAANAGAQYLVLASLSGTAPGLTVNGITVPLNYDGLTAASVTLANSAMFADTFGTLDGAGNATARFVLPPGVAGALTGQTITFAYALLTPAIRFPSNPARVVLVQ